MYLNAIYMLIKVEDEVLQQFQVPSTPLIPPSNESTNEPTNN